MIFSADIKTDSETNVC